MERKERMGCDRRVLQKLTVGIAVITHRAKLHLPRCLPPLINSALKPRVLVVNSSSNDGTVELAEALGAETLLIPRSEFNHGSTRERARRHLGTDIVVMVTPDAYAAGEKTLDRLVQPLLEGEASISYARQVAHDRADFFESFPRQFNYPKESHIRSINDVEKYGVYTFFCSDSCAAYLNSALDEIGGFPEVLLGEDTVVVARLLRRGHKIAYVAEAVVKHSHRYSVKQEFKRYFDTGLARNSHAELLACKGGDAGRGAAYTKELLIRLLKKKPTKIPYAILQTAAKYSGYKIGQFSQNAPFWLKRALSSQEFYWQNKK